MEKPKILMVDDDKLAHKYVNTYFQLEGYKPDWAGSAAQAKILLRQNDYDFVISDINMPLESGSELAQYINDNYPSIGVVLTSAVPELISMADFYRKHSLGFIEKPLLPYKFEEIIGANSHKIVKLKREVANVC